MATVRTIKWQGLAPKDPQPSPLSVGSGTAAGPGMLLLSQVFGAISEYEQWSYIHQWGGGGVRNRICGLPPGTGAWGGGNLDWKSRCWLSPYQVLPLPAPGPLQMLPLLSWQVLAHPLRPLWEVLPASQVRARPIHPARIFIRRPHRMLRTLRGWLYNAGPSRRCQWSGPGSGALRPYS